MQPIRQISEAHTVLISTARIATHNSADMITSGHKGGHIVIDMTAVPGVETVTFTVQGKDPLSGKYYTILASTAISATGTTVLKVFPGATAAANAAANDILPETWRVACTHSASGSFTYSVGASLTA